MQVYLVWEEWFDNRRPSLVGVYFAREKANGEAARVAAWHAGGIGGTFTVKPTSRTNPNVVCDVMYPAPVATKLQVYVSSHVEGPTYS